MLDFTGSSNHNHGFPRMRGEYPSLSVTCRLTLGSPPHTRGVSFLLSTSSRPLRITPACAGNTYNIAGFDVSYRDHPRLRGEYDTALTQKCNEMGSPPLARGIHGCIERRGHAHGITPACAGNTYNIAGFDVSYRDHPRLRGEYLRKPYS